VVSIAADLADRPTDPGALAMLAAVAARNQDARTLLLIGKGAMARGLPFEMHAFPIVGLPRYTPAGPQVDQAVAYSIARQESAFNPRAISSANALGLMQVTPAAGKHIAKRIGVTFDQKRLLSDPAYNVQIGAAELGDALETYRGSYILTFASYNAGRGRVREWVERYGDPRDPKVDPIDWVERIPFSETRNYVQRILENMQVYRVRFGGSSRLMIEADLRRGASGN
jgi:soluble lytic murein transglycosylase